MTEQQLKEMYHQASSLKQEEHFQQARDLFTQIIQWSTANHLKSGAHFHLGEIALKEKHVPLSKDHFFLSLQLNPTHQKARAYLEESVNSPAEKERLKKIVYYEQEVESLATIFGIAKLADLVLTQTHINHFLADSTGAAYHVTRDQKQELLAQFKINNEKVPCATSWLYHVVMASEILNIPPTIAGDIIECGVWKGGSAVNLSLVCQLTGRKLLVCDSFAGLPADEEGKKHLYPHLQVYGYYRQGMYQSPLEEVKANIAAYGSLSSCLFVPGYFKDSLRQLNTPLVFAFFDVDLASSLKDCIRYTWPLLVDGGLMYTDDSCDMEVVNVWFDEGWWQQELNRPAPGYVGSGCGLPLNSCFSSLGYARKISDPLKQYHRISWLSYPD